MSTTSIGAAAAVAGAGAETAVDRLVAPAPDILCTRRNSRMEQESAMTRMQSVASYVRRPPLDRDADERARMCQALFSDEETVDRWLEQALKRALAAELRRL